MRMLCLFTVLLAACRIGDRGGDALALVEPPIDAGPREAGNESSEPVSDDEGDADVPPDAGDSSVPSADDGAVVEPSDAGDEAGSDASGEACEDVIFAGCDPVHNTGCTAGLNQCVLDRTVAAATGICVFNLGAATPCDESALWTYCPPLHACVAGECRRYCSCSSDCDQGQSCGEPIPGTSSGVKTCAADEG